MSKASKGLQAIQDAQLRRQIIGATAAPADQLAKTLNEALAHPRGWQFITLTRGDQQLGGMIVVRDVNVFEKIVALIDSRCAPPTDGGNAS